MRRLKYVLQSAIACFVVAGALLVLFWGAGIYNIYHESHGNISDLSELWSYISEQGLMFLIGLLAFVSFLVSGFQAKKASEADRAANGGNEYDGVGYGDADYSGTINAGGGYTYDSMDTSIKLDEGSGMENDRNVYGKNGMPYADIYGMTGDAQLTNTYSLQLGARKISFDNMNAHQTIYVITPEYTTGSQIILRDNLAPMVKGKHVLILAASILTGYSVQAAIEAINYYGGTVAGLSAIFATATECLGIPVTSIFDPSNLPDYASFDSRECPMCKAGQHIDALVNSFGYSAL